MELEALLVPILQDQLESATNFYFQRLSANKDAATYTGSLYQEELMKYSLFWVIQPVLLGWTNFELTQSTTLLFACCWRTKSTKQVSDTVSKVKKEAEMNVNFINTNNEFQDFENLRFTTLPGLWLRLQSILRKEFWQAAVEETLYNVWNDYTTRAKELEDT